ncbi:MAG: hypothetical protein PWQ57_1399 [Desulfovibrionales bacterium]|jgi:hypothetical protein|nr:hypothetical protein [Desulfovibrionales bacterium]
MIRKKAFWIFCVTALALAFGCSTIEPTTLMNRDGGNVVRFFNPETGLRAEIRIAPAYAFLREANTTVNGVALQGPVYANGDDYVLVTELSQDGFSRLGGEVKPSGRAVRPLDTEPTLQTEFCLLNFAKAAAMGDDVVGAVFMRDLSAGATNATCPWRSLEELEQDRPGMLEAYKETAAEAVTTSW